MPRKPKPQLHAWSFSRWEAYENCPLQTKLRYIEKLDVDEEKGPALIRGQEIHDLAANYVRTKRAPKKMPKDLENFTEEFRELRALARKGVVHVEQQWAFDASWSPVDWFARDAWVRVVADVAIEIIAHNTVRIIDHKTGKRRTRHVEQLGLYALACFKKFSWAQTVESALWYLDLGEDPSFTFDITEVPRLEKLWTKKTRAMLADRRFVPKPGDACRWCSFTKAKGGPCRY